MSDSTLPSESANRIEEQAGEWLQRKRYWKDWSEGDQQQLDAWLAESMLHSVAYWRLEAALERVERLSVLRPQKFERRPAQPARSPLRSLRAVAALAVVGIVGVTAAISLRSEPRGQTYSTAPGGHTVIKLTDGSSIELNTNTIIHTDVGADRRYVSIERGEAYFDIVHNAAHPFMVDVSGHRITDIGTKFVVRKKAQSVELTLVEGRASIASMQPGTQAHSAILTPGEVAIATADSLSIEQKSPVVVTKELSWRHGMLVFDGAPLSSVAAELNRYGHEKLVVEGDDVKKLTIDASVPTNNVRAFTRVARDVFGLHVEDRGNKIVISR